MTLAAPRLPIKPVRELPERLSVIPLLYELYGLPVQSGIPLNARRLNSGKPAVIISEAPKFFFEKIQSVSPGLLSRPIDYLPLQDGSVYIRFFQLFYFWVSKNGRKILFRKIKSKKKNSSSVISPLIFLQTNVFSFSLLKLGFEAFHASCIAAGNNAVAFLGESGYGKSTLAASFLKNGFPLLTDDVFAVRKMGKRFLTPPGVAQIKLFPAIARQILTRPAPAGKMSPIAKKWILPLDSGVMGKKNFEVGLVYLLWPSFKKNSGAIRIRKIKPQEAVISLIKASHNLVLQDSKRLRTQMLFAADLVKTVPVRAISFPMNLKTISAVQEKLQEDITRVFARARRQKATRPMAVRF